MSCGIYKITNKINGKVYIGQSKNIEKRWLGHRVSNDNCSIHQAFQKYGIDNFEFTILLTCPEDMIDAWEIDMISLYDSQKTGYNCTQGGDSGPVMIGENNPSWKGGVTKNPKYKTIKSRERKQYMNQYYKDHHEDHKQYMKQYREKHREEIKQYQKQYYKIKKGLAS